MIGPVQLDLFGEPVARFDGKTYSQEHDWARMAPCLSAVCRVLLRHGEWLTLSQIAAEVERDTGVSYPTQSISARVRDLRKRRFGAFVVERRRLGDPSRGVHGYQLARRK